MARTTHDRTRDHRGSDKATNIKLDGATTNYADLDVLQTVISDIDDRIDAAGVGSGSSAYTDLLTGDDSNFDGSIGTWVAVGGAGASVAYDSSVGLLGTSYGSLKISTTTNSAVKGGSVSVPGTFLSGHLYELVVAVRSQVESGGLTTGYAVTLGDQGASDFSNGPVLEFRQVGDTATGNWSESDKVILARSLWRPSSNRTSVTVKIRRWPFDDNQSRDLWVLLARVVEIPQGQPLLSSTLGVVDDTGIARFGPTENSGYKGFGSDLLGGGAAFRLNGSGRSASVDSGKDADGNWDSFQAGPGFAYIYGTQPSGAGRRSAGDNFEGVDEEHGPDYVGTIRGERSATEVEWAPDGEYDVVLIDGGNDADTTHFWFTENADGTQKSALNLLHNLKVGTVDPSAGGGVASAVGSFYSRNNSGVGELWVKTGAGNTAWTRLNSSAITAQPGPPGPAGEDGEPGLPGTTGATGATGATGLTGASGAPGIPGIDGEDGRDGIAGAPGVAGATGATGPTGPAGLGVPGVDGEDGIDGRPGVDGATGATGATGLAGRPGFDGVDGDDGWPGPPGVAGNTGATGSTGPTGPAGIDGRPGFDGSDGEDGWAGPPGVAGPTGTTGSTGATGPAGMDGRPGYDGNDGDDGLWGPPGPAGPAGSAGSLTLTVAEVSLLAAPNARRSGHVQITSSGLTTGKPVLIQQAVGPYTGKGTRADEAEMDRLTCTATVLNATTIDVYWESTYLVRGNYKFAYAVSA